MENRILFDDLNNNGMLVYESEDDEQIVKLRYFNGKEFSWLDYYPQGDRIHGLWINHSFLEDNANKQIKECLESSPYLIVSWKTRTYSNDIHTSIYLSIIGINNLYVYENHIPPVWFKI